MKEEIDVTPSEKVDFHVVDEYLFFQSGQACALCKCCFPGKVGKILAQLQW